MSLFGGLFGGGSDTPQVTPTLPSINAGGLIGKVNSGGRAKVTAQPVRSNLVSGLERSYQNLGNEYGNLRSTVAPGYNDLLNARIVQINDAARKSLGNLRQNLAARRILGSSFGQDTLARADLAASRLRDQAIADNFLKSLHENQQLLGQQYNAYANQFNTGLNELNLEKDVAQNLATNGANILNQTARFNAGMTAKAQAGAGSFLGTLLGQGVKLAEPLLASAFAPATGGASLLPATALTTGAGLW
jgi:hypothetical protein